jgi:hypothetical protein
MPRTVTRTRNALVGNPYSAYSKEPVPVRIGRSKASAAGADGVQFTAPGWRAMVFKSMDAAARKIETHPGFAGWVA